MEPHDAWLLTDLFRAVGHGANTGDDGDAGDAGNAGDDVNSAPAPADSPFAELRCACEVLMSDVGEASLRAVADRALRAYGALDDEGRLAFFTHLLRSYGADADEVRSAFQRWETARDAGAAGDEELVGLFDAVEPARQQLLRRMHHAPDATLALVGMRADLRRLLRHHPELRPLDHDFHHLLTSWFNRGFLRMAQVTREAPEELQAHLLRYERVHPMASRQELRRRLAPADRRAYAFFHPATGEVPLIFVEVALVDGLPEQIEPLLEPGPALDPARADTAVLYSINNTLDGLAGISFGSFLIKQVIEQVGEELPHLRQFATLSPLPGFRRWLAEQAEADAELHTLAEELAALGGVSGLAAANAEPLRARLLPVLARYLVVERRGDGRPLDPVARFHLGNGATAWQLDWPANTSAEAWRQSYGAMVNYRYEPARLERQHEEFVRRGSVAVGGPLRDVVPAP